MNPFYFVAEKLKRVGNRTEALVRWRSRTTDIGDARQEMPGQGPSLAFKSAACATYAGCFQGVSYQPKTDAWVSSRSALRLIG
jgi:hypothetical protein